MKEAQQVVAEKTSSLEAEAYKTKRLQVSLRLTYIAYNREVFSSGAYRHKIIYISSENFASS